LPGPSSRHGWAGPRSHPEQLKRSSDPASTNPHTGPMAGKRGRGLAFPCPWGSRRSDAGAYGFFGAKPERNQPAGTLFPQSAPARGDWSLMKRPWVYQVFCGAAKGRANWGGAAVRSTETKMGLPGRLRGKLPRPFHTPNYAPALSFPRPGQLTGQGLFQERPRAIRFPLLGDDEKVGLYETFCSSGLSKRGNRPTGFSRMGPCGPPEHTLTGKSRELNPVRPWRGPISLDHHEHGPAARLTSSSRGASLDGKVSEGPLTRRRDIPRQTSRFTLV